MDVAHGVSYFEASERASELAHPPLWVWAWEAVVARIWISVVTSKPFKHVLVDELINYEDFMLEKYNICIKKNSEKIF